MRSEYVIYLGEKGMKLAQGETFFKEQIPKCLTKKFKEDMLVKSKLLYIIRKLLKCKYLK
jgi:hypothetical protein